MSKNKVTKEVLNYLEISRSQNEINSRLKLQWIENFVDMSKACCNDTNNASYAALFWIRLGGLIELKSELITITDKLHVKTPAILKIINQLFNEFSEDELIYADYLRLTNAHPTQTSYDVRWSKKKQKMLNKRCVPAIGRDITTSDLDLTINRILRQFPSEQAIAVDFANRCQKYTGNLLVEANNYYGIYIK